MPMYAQIIWDEEPGGNVEYIGQRGVTPEEFEEILLDDSIPTVFSRSSDRPSKAGYTSTGKFIRIVWQEECDDPLIVNPVTAFFPEDPLDG